MPLRPPVRIVLSAASAGERIVLPLEKGLEMEFVHIPAGEFLMGSDPEKDGWADYTEVPQHRVNLSEYWLGRTPVTNAQYAVFTLSTGAKVPEHWRNNQPPQDLLDHPVVFVSWHEAVACCEWLSQQTGRRVGLPTETQWEKAARGTDGRLYPWGSEAPDAARCNFNRNNQTTPVGQYTPLGDSPYGCVDMAGNVLEWCADWYEDKYYLQSPADNPPGPDTGEQRVLRGSSCFDSAPFVRAARRAHTRPAFSRYLWGFRCALAHQQA